MHKFLSGSDGEMLYYEILTHRLRCACTGIPPEAHPRERKGITGKESIRVVSHADVGQTGLQFHSEVRVTGTYIWYWKMGSIDEFDEGLWCSSKVTFLSRTEHVARNTYSLLPADAEWSQKVSRLFETSTFNSPKPDSTLATSRTRKSLKKHFSNYNTICIHCKSSSIH